MASHSLMVWLRNLGPGGNEADGEIAFPDTPFGMREAGPVTSRSPQYDRRSKAWAPKVDSWSSPVKARLNNRGKVKPYSYTVVDDPGSGSRPQSRSQMGRTPSPQLRSRSRLLSSPQPQDLCRASPSPVPSSWTTQGLFMADGRPMSRGAGAAARRFPVLRDTLMLAESKSSRSSPVPQCMPDVSGARVQAKAESTASKINSRPPFVVATSRPHLLERQPSPHEQGPLSPRRGADRVADPPGGDTSCDIDSESCPAEASGLAITIEPEEVDYVASTSSQSPSRAKGGYSAPSSLRSAAAQVAFVSESGPESPAGGRNQLLLAPASLSSSRRASKNLDSGKDPQERISNKSAKSVSPDSSHDASQAVGRKLRPSGVAPVAQQSVQICTPKVRKDKPRLNRAGTSASYNQHMKRAQRLRRLDTLCQQRWCKRSDDIDFEFGQEVFNRYFREGNTEDTKASDNEDLLEALADLGCRARTRAEQSGLLQILSGFEEDPTLSGFYRIWQAARATLQRARAPVFFQGWTVLDREDTSYLSVVQVRNLFEDLEALPPQHYPEYWDAQVCIESLPKNGKGLIGFQDALLCYEQLQESTEVAARKREHEVQDTCDITGELATEFRSELSSFYVAFCAYSGPNKRSINVHQALEVLTTLGFDSISEEVLTKNIGGVGLLWFNGFLDIVKELRKVLIQGRSEDVSMRFKKKHTGLLETHELLQLLETLNLQAKNTLEQRAIAHIVEIFNLNFEGVFNLTDAQRIIQRIYECLGRVRYEAELERADSLQFDRAKTFALRKAFEDTCKEADSADGRPGLKRDGVERAVARGLGLRSVQLSQSISDEYAELLDESRGGIDFLTFLGVVRQVEDENSKAYWLKR